MKRFIVYYNSTSGDLCHVWTEAKNRNDAASKIRSEYWECKEIVSISEQR